MVRKELIRISITVPRELDKQLNEIVKTSNALEKVPKEKITKSELFVAGVQMLVDTAVNYKQKHTVNKEEN